MKAAALLAPFFPANPIPEGCPWHGLSEYGLPNVNWCEESLCAWVNEPANAWSNLAYVLAGLWLVLSTRGGQTLAAPDGRPSILRFFAPIVALVGVCSFIYHASNVYLTQMLDFLGMYLFCFLLLGLNAMRLGWLTGSGFPRFFLASVAGLTGITSVVVRFGFPIQSLISLLTLAILVTEFLIRRRHQAAGGGSHRYHLSAFFLSFALLIAGAACSASDLTRRWCDPSNRFIQGHAAWHVLSALSLLASFYHFRQFSRAAGGVLTLAILTLASVGCGGDMGPGPSPDGLPVPTLGETVQVVPGPGLPDAFNQARMDLGARSNNNLDVVRHADRIFLATRLAPDHFASDKTSLFVFSSADQRTWDLETRISLGTDVREPRFLSYRGRLFLYFAKLGSDPLGFEPQGMLYTEYQGPGKWTVPSGFYRANEPYIPWRAKVRGGHAYLTTYLNGKHLYDFSGQPMDIELLTSDDGLTWQALPGGRKVVSQGGGSETDFDFSPDGDIYAVIRNEAGDSTGWGSKLCHADASALTSWSCRHDPKKYDSPLVFAYKGQILLIGRRNVTDTGNYELHPGLPWSATETVNNQVDYIGQPKRCSLWLVDPGSDPGAAGPQVRFIVDLPGWGDTCFPSLLPDPASPSHFYLYNYSSPLDDPANADLGWHDGQEGDTRIYRTELTLW